MGENIDVTRRDALKATGGLIGGLTVGGATVSSAATQDTYYRYEAVQVRLVDVDARPPQFHTVERALYLTEPLLADCDTDHPCSIDVLDYDASDDDDDSDDGDDDGTDDGSDNDDGADDDGGSDDDGDDDNGDDDRGCPGFASVVLLCHGDSSSDAVVLAGLMPDVLSEYAERGFDFVVGLSPSDATSVDDPETVSTPCPATDDDGNDDTDDDNSGDDDADDAGNDDGDDDDGNDDTNDDGADDN